MQIENASGTQSSDVWDQLQELSEKLSFLNRAVEDPSLVPTMNETDLAQHMDLMEAEMSNFEAAVASANPEVRADEYLGASVHRSGPAASCYGHESGLPRPSPLALASKTAHDLGERRQQLCSSTSS